MKRLPPCLHEGCLRDEPEEERRWFQLAGEGGLDEDEGVDELGVREVEGVVAREAGRVREREGRAGALGRRRRCERGRRRALAGGAGWGRAHGQRGRLKALPVAWETHGITCSVLQLSVCPAKQVGRRSERRLSQEQSSVARRRRPSRAAKS